MINQRIARKLKANTLPKNAVGRSIATRIPTVAPDKTIGEVKELLPEFAKKTASINYIYVIDKKNKLLGVFSIKELTQHPEETRVEKVMEKKLVVSYPQVDRRRVAYLAVKQNIKAVPVVDKKNHLLGVLPSDKIFSILYRQYQDSFHHFSGVISLGQNYTTILDLSILRNVLSRLPWIIVGLSGGIFAAQIIEFFETTLSANIVLAVFIPLVVYISNAVGAQTQTFLVRDLAFISKISIIPYFFKQFISSTLLGLICGGIIWLIVSIFWKLPYAGFVIGLASFISISLSTIIAVSIPYFLNVLKQEPASGSGPLATILQDLLSIFIYFLIASALL